MNHVFSHNHVNCCDIMNPSYFTSVSKPKYLNPTMFHGKKRSREHMWLAWLYVVLFFSFSIFRKTKLFQMAVPVVLALLCLIPTVDAPIQTGMYMQMNINTRKMFHHC